MANATAKWKLSGRTSNPETVLSTGLNSLADGAGVSPGSVSNDQATELDMYADFELYLASLNPAADDDSVDLYLLRQVDGSNYVDTDAEGRPREGYVGSFLLNAGAATKRLILPRVELPPADFQVYVINNAGVALAASGNTLKMYAYNIEAVE